MKTNKTCFSTGYGGHLGESPNEFQAIPTPVRLHQRSDRRDPRGEPRAAASRSDECRSDAKKSRLSMRPELRELPETTPACQQKKTDQKRFNAENQRSEIKAGLMLLHNPYILCVCFHVFPPSFSILLHPSIHNDTSFARRHEQSLSWRQPTFRVGRCMPATLSATLSAWLTV